MASLLQPSRDDGADPVLGTYRAKPLLRVAAYATPVCIAAMVLILAQSDFLTTIPLPFMVAFGVAVAYNSVFLLWMVTQRIVLTADGIEQSAFGTTTFMRYDDIASMWLRRGNQFDLLGISGDMCGITEVTRIGDSRGSRILIMGFLSQYNIVTEYILSRIGDRELGHCPRTKIEILKWVLVAVFAACFVLLIVFPDLWQWGARSAR